MTELFQDIINRPTTSYLRNLTTTQLSTLNEFEKYNEYKNFAQQTRERQLKLVARLGVETGKEFQDMAKEDVVNWLRSKDIKPYTLQTYQLYCQKFFKWFGKDIKGWFEKINNAYDKVIAPSELWSPEEIEELIKVFPEIQYKAVVATLFDSAARVSELCSMNIEDVEFVNGIGVIYLRESKTQRRRIELIFATEYLVAWYNVRDAQGEPSDPLWLSKCNRNRGRRLTQGGVYEILKFGRKLLGTSKKLHPHLLRHSMASYLRKNGYPDALHKKRMGLKPHSFVLERYTHVSDAEVSEGARNAFGAEPVKPVKQKENPLIPKKCPRCGAHNNITDKICKKCYYSINYENTERDLTILEIFKSRFLELERIDIESLIKNYRNFKEETKNMELILEAFEVSDEVTNYVIQWKLGLKGDECLGILQYLISCKLITMTGDKVYLINRGEFQRFITVYKRYVEVRH